MGSTERYGRSRHRWRLGKVVACGIVADCGFCTAALKVCIVVEGGSGA